MSNPYRTIDLLVDDEKLHGLRLIIPGEWLPKGSRTAELRLRISAEPQNHLPVHSLGNLRTATDLAAFIFLTAPQMRQVGKVLIREAERMDRKYAKVGPNG